MAFGDLSFYLTSKDDFWAQNFFGIFYHSDDEELNEIKHLRNGKSFLQNFILHRVANLFKKSFNDIKCVNLNAAQKLPKQCHNNLMQFLQPLFLYFRFFSKVDCQ